MRTYRRLWLWWWASIGALGLLTGAITVPVPALLSVLVIAASVGGFLSVLLICVGSDQQIGSADLVRLAVRRGLPLALVVATVVVSSFSLGPVTGPLLVLCALTSPWTVRTLVRARPSRQPRAGECPQAPRPEPERPALQASDWAPAVQALSDEELCRSWRASYTAMQGASTGECVELVVLRQAYLDDLERRNPRGLRSWLDSGARAAGNPARYLASDRPG